MTGAQPLSVVKEEKPVAGCRPRSLSATEGGSKWTRGLLTWLRLTHPEGYSLWWANPLEWWNPKNFVPHVLVYDEQTWWLHLNGANSEQMGWKGKDHNMLSLTMQLSSINPECCSHFLVPVSASWDRGRWLTRNTWPETVFILLRP